MGFEAPKSTTVKSAPRPAPLSGSVLQRFCAGDISVLDEVVENQQHVACFVARHYLGTDEVALDVVQDAFVRAFERRQQFDPTRPFQAWFLTIVRNLCLDHLRRVRGHASLDSVPMPQVSTGASAAEENLNRREQAERITSVMQSIPQPYREYVVLRDVQSLSPQDIATMTGVDYNTTRWRIHKARQLFRNLWVERYGELEP
jgi:RNA polymerase sigma factor (sigma-70 family)